MSGRTELIAAFVSGLGLHGCVVAGGPPGAVQAVPAPADGRLPLGLWCASRGHAEVLAGAAAQAGLGDLDAVAALAAELGVPAIPTADVLALADRAVARALFDVETARMAGKLKSLNRAFRARRIAAAKSGERFVSYSVFLNRYTLELVRAAAAAARASGDPLAPRPAGAFPTGDDRAQPPAR